MIFMSKIKVAIDSGHSITTAGKRTPPFIKDVDVYGDGKVIVKRGEQYREHAANTGVAYLLDIELRKRGYDTVKTGWNDSNPYDDTYDTPLTIRQQVIRNAKCDYSISVHFNAHGNGNTFTTAQGVEILIHNSSAGDSKSMADFVLKELVKGSKQTNRGVKTQALSMCNCNTMGTKAAILLELCFMTNEREAHELMANSKFWAECAKEVADGFENYLKSKGVTTTPTTPSKPVNAPTQSNNNEVYHTVVRGDTLFGIANRYKTTVDKIKSLNGLTTNTIRVGQKLIVDGYRTYTVVSGDTLSRISLNLLGSANRWNEIMSLNGLTNTNIRIGQVLKIPNK